MGVPQSAVSFLRELLHGRHAAEGSGNTSNGIAAAFAWDYICIKAPGVLRGGGDGGAFCRHSSVQIDVRRDISTGGIIKGSAAP